MTAIYYGDCESTSPSGRFALEARSPHNGTIRYRDGRTPTEDEFPFKYRQHQSEFRYRLLDNSRRRLLSRITGGDPRTLVWERWQLRGEDSPRELLVSDEGSSVIRTHGFCPEVIAVDPSGGDVVRVRITGPGSGHGIHPKVDIPVYSWSPEYLDFSTAGLYWTAHSFPYFFQLNGDPFFAWRTYWGQRLVIDLGRAAICTDEQLGEAALAGALADEERRQVHSLLSGLSRRMAEVRSLLAHRREEEDRNPVWEKIR